MNQPYKRDMIREAVANLGSPTTNTAVRQYIHAKYADVKDTTISAHLVSCAVNHPSRIHYPENKKPRLCDGPYDILFRTGRGEQAAYDPAVHGEWERYATTPAARLKSGYAD